MTCLTIRNLDETLKRRRRVRAAGHGRSIDDEVRNILRAAPNAETAEPEKLGSAIHALFAPLGGLDLPETARDSIRPSPAFE